MIGQPCPTIWANGERASSPTTSSHGHGAVTETMKTRHIASGDIGASSRLFKKSDPPPTTCRQLGIVTLPRQREVSEAMTRL